MTALTAVMLREGKIRVTNLTFIFWDLFYPLGYLLVFGVGINASLGFTATQSGVDYNAFFLAGVLADGVDVGGPETCAGLGTSAGLELGVPVSTRTSE